MTGALTMFDACCSKSEEGVPVEKVNRNECAEKQMEIPSNVEEPDAELDGVLAPLWLPRTDPNMFYVCIVAVQEKGVGLDLDLLDDTGIMINDVLGGAAKCWNGRADPDHQMRYGDRIMEVNGTRGSSQDHLERIRDEGSLQMWIKRPVVVRVSGDLALDALGLVVTYAPDGRTLLIQEIKSGIVKNWNVDNPNLTVQEHDRIVEVNGVTGLAAELMALLRVEVQLELVIFCYNI